MIIQKQIEIFHMLILELMEGPRAAAKLLELELSSDACFGAKVIMSEEEYCSALTPFEKAEILENSENEIFVLYSCACVGNSTEIYYECKKLVLSGECELDKTPSNQLLKEEEENFFFCNKFWIPDLILSVCEVLAFVFLYNNSLGYVITLFTSY